MKIQTSDHFTPEALTKFFCSIEENGKLYVQEKRLILFVVLSASHLKHCLDLEWTDIDLEKCVWTLPADKSKYGSSQVIPLTDMMFKIINLQKSEQNDSNFVFPNLLDPSSPMSSKRLTLALKFCGLDGLSTLYSFRPLFFSLVSDSDQWSVESVRNTIGHLEFNETLIKNDKNALKDRKAILEWYGEYMKKWANSLNII